MTNTTLASTTYIQQQLGHTKPQVGIILGSGLGNLVNTITQRQSLPYSEIPNFPQPKVEGHNGQLHIGYLAGVSVVCLQGRSHLYEGIDYDIFINLVHTIKQLGCNTLIITNAAGSFHADMPAGELMLISDHINLQFNNVLVGCFNNEFGPPFINMENAYCPELRQELRNVAQQIGFTLKEGVYVGVLGPSFETPAEIRAFARLGADAIGMSTIPEVIVARQCDMRVAAISVITNMAAGLSQEKLSHHHTLENAQRSSEKLTQLIIGFLATTNLI